MDHKSEIINMIFMKIISGDLTNDHFKVRIEDKQS
jgi:hypothetical protein